MRFKGLEETDHQEFGEGYRWLFEKISGTDAGVEASAATKREATMKNKAGRFLAALAGVAPSEELDLDPGDFIGNEYSVMVESNADGSGTRIASFTPVDASEAGEADEVDEEETTPF